MLLGVCVDPSGDGLYPISRARSFDFSLCFERVVLLPGLAGFFGVIGLVNVVYLLRTRNVLARGGASRLVLYAKLVRTLQLQIE